MERRLMMGNRGGGGRHALWAIGCRRWLLATSVGLLLAPEPAARAQLAVTEVMSSESTNCSGVLTNLVDWWELTNFGSNSVDLTGYLFIDRDKVFPEGAWQFPSILIAPGESIILVGNSTGVVDPPSFKAWWGPTNLPPDLRIFFYGRGYGFDSEGDTVRFYDSESNAVDHAVFDLAVRGTSFTYDTNSGQFGELTELGSDHVFRSACGDIGSPGFAPSGPIPIRITRQPVSQSVDQGMEVAFRVESYGLPRPRPEWYFDGAPILNPTADIIPMVVNYAGCGLAWKTSSKGTDLAIPNVQPSHAGEYCVVLDNGLDRMTSSVVTLTVNTNPTAPRVECLPPELCFPLVDGQPQTNLVVTLLQTAEFDVRVRAYPMPSFRWSWSADGRDFADLPRATNRTYVINNVVPGNVGTYRVRIQNSKGTNYAYATLSVGQKPRLKVTEVMPDPCAGMNKNWWELTNLGDAPVNLYGYRWDDSPGNIGGGPTVTNVVIIQPGESVIFLEAQTPESFITRWGTENLPPKLQFIRYAANGMSDDGDEINLWNPTASEDFDFIDSVAFSLATPGASFWFLTDYCQESWYGIPSIEGDCGTFRAAVECEVGSPGWTPWTPPCLTSIMRKGAIATLKWKAQPGSTNHVQYTRSLTAPSSAISWTELGTYSFPGASGSAIDATLGADSQRFYRVVRAAPNHCACPQGEVP